MRTKPVSVRLGAVLYLLLLLLPAIGLRAQTDITIGLGNGSNSTTSYPCPIQDWYQATRAQYLYRASELTAKGMGPGMINALKFNATSVGSDVDGAENYAIKIVGTTVSSLSDSYYEPVGNNFYGPLNYMPVVGLNSFTIPSGFFWNGTDNILVEVCGGAASYTHNPVFPYTTGLAFNGSHTYYQDAGTSLCGTSQVNSASTTRPDIIFNWTPAAACTGTPTAGTAASSASAVCLNESFTLSLTGVTVASGLKYQWQSSTDNSTWTNIPNDTLSSLTTTQTVSSYYRCVVTCTASSNAANSTSVQVTSPSLVHGTFTINKALPTGAGNFASFNDAYNYIKCGIDGAVVFNVVANAASAYNEQLIMTPVPGASATNTVTFNGNNDTIAYLSTSSAERAVIKLNGADYITFNDLIIQAKGSSSGQYGFGVQLLNDADYNTINNCKILINTTSTSSDFAGIVVSASATSATGTGSTSCDNNTFSNNTVTGGYYSMTLVASSTASNASNKVINNKFLDFYYYGMYIYGAYNLTFEKNTISRPSRTSVDNFYGIYVTNLSTKLNINANRITNPFGGNPTSTSTFYAIYFTSVDALNTLENVVSNNLIYNLTGSGSVYGFYNSSSDNVFYYHNTLSLDGSATPGTSYVTRGFYQTTQAAGVYLRDNMITINRGGQNIKHGIYFGTTSSDIVSNYNNIYLAATVANAYTGYYSANRATLTDWQTAATQDANSLAANPIYKDSTNGNYAPSSQTVNDRGFPVGIAADINSTTRSTSTPDMGAYEFTPDPCTAPPVPGTSTVNKNPVCVGTNVGLGLNGNSNGLTQTYQWQYATTATGPWTNLGTPINYPDTVIVSTATLYYRTAVTCSGNTAYSTPVLLTVNPALPPNTYTVDKNSPASATNYTSFAAVKTALECGITGPVVFNVVAGRTPYEEQFSLDSVRGTSAINTITFLGNGNTIHYSSNTTDERAVIKLKHTDHIIFDSLNIDATGTGTYGYGVQFIDHADSNVVRHSNIVTNTTDGYNSNYAGIVINASDSDPATTGATRCTGNVIDSNTVTGGLYSVTIVGGSSDPVYGTTIRNNILQEFYYYGLYLEYTSGTLLKGNTIQRPTRTNVSYYYGLYAYGENTNLSVLENRFTNPFGGSLTSTNYFYGIYFSSVSSNSNTPILVANNIMYKTTGAGYQYGFYNYNSPNINYYHNTISLDNTGGSSSYYSRGYYQSSTTTGINFKNNIITINNSGANYKYAVYLSSTGTEFFADHNDYYVAGGGNNKFIGYNNGNQATLADWRGSTGQDAATISIDPVYADAPNGNLTPVIYPLDNTGIPLGITNDILHKTRSTTTPDIGAYEIDIVPCMSPLNPGTAVVTPNSNICMGTQITLDLTNNTPGGRMTYQWQASYTATGPWINVSDTLYVSQYKMELGMLNYFRCKIVCSGTDSAFSTIATVAMNAPLVKGLYTINPTGTGSRNFTSFQQAVTALECGIAGWVIFDVVPGTYNEKIRMRKIPGASDTSRVTFRSQTGDPISVTLTTPPTSAANYVLKLDSASYVTYKNITIKATGSTYARVVELAGNAAYDSLLTNILSMPSTTTNSTNMVGVYATSFKGNNNAIVGNTIQNGASGIYFSGTGTGELATSIVIDSNFIAGAYVNGIYSSYVDHIVITRNNVNLTTPLASTAYGIYNYYDDGAFKTNHNIVNISNASTTTYGIYTYSCDASQADTAQMDGNRVIATTGNTGTMYGLGHQYSTYVNNVNNVINIATSGSSSYGLYSSSDANSVYYNNTVQSAATSSANNIAAYLGHASAGYSNVFYRNNIFSHTGGGYAMYTTSVGYHNSDYNTLYTSGTNLIRNTNTGANYTTLNDFVTAADQDVHSIVYKPAFEAGNNNLLPDLNNPEVWAIHGRGVQVRGNAHDFSGAYRPQTLAEGVPDMGAYEFLPAVEPVLLTPVPAAPSPGITQTFMFGTDTVAKVTWAASGAVPTSLTLKRYSGIKPPNLTPTQEFMYFYTDVDASGQYSNFDFKQYYVPSWQGTFTDEKTIHLGRTNNDSAWVVNDSSKVDTDFKTISENQLSYLDRYTGLKGSEPDVPSFPALPDSSNRGTRFWVGYGHQYYMNVDNSQNMVLYLSAQQPAHVVVKIHGTSYRKEYTVPANSVLASDIIPKAGLSDARLLGEGLYEQGISIESDVPIVAYAHIYSSASSGATMLLPVGTYGYEYYALTSRQNYSSTSYSWFYIIADNDNTVVEITPSVPTLAGKPAKVPFTVTLNKGQVYQVLGAIMSGSEGYDLSGSKVRSITNAAGKCYPVAVFSGNSRTSLGCDGSIGSSGDNAIQQNFPSQAWGMHYLTAPTSSSDDPATLSTNIFRVMVKDSATVVKLNNVPLTGLINGRYYQYQSNTADYLEANQPIMVAQYMASEGACPNTGSMGDPEMFYISPLEQGINAVGLYRNVLEAIDVNYLTVIIPTGALSSLLIDNSNLFDYTYAHPNKPGYSVVVKRWSAASAQCIVTSDSAFTAVTYGMGSVESYGFNAGTLVRNLNATTSFNNNYGSSSSSNYTCAGTPFHFTAMLPIKPVSITWELSQVSNLLPAGDVTQTNPVALDSIVANGKTYYKYDLTGDYMFTAPGTYYIPMKMQHPEIESCDNTSEVILTIKVIRKPVVDYSVDYSGCVADIAELTGSVITENNAAINTWKWNFADGTTASTQKVTRQYPAAGTYVEELHIITSEGCIGDTTKEVVANEPTAAKLVTDSFTVCYNSSVTFTVKDPETGVTYRWFNAKTGGALLDTGNTFTINPVTTPGIYYVEAMKNGCVSTSRTPATVTVLPQLTVPVVEVDSIGVNTIRFKWNAIPGATGYEVSIDGGNTWTTPSSGAQGTEHIVTGLKPVQEVTLIVKVKGCEDKLSDPVSAVTLTDGIYIPNAFSPNGDGLNDVLKVYGAVISEVHFMVFNQWGEKVFESNDQSVGWDGFYKSKAQPSGVYIYVVKLKLIDGSAVDRKGSVNLIR